MDELHELVAWIYAEPRNDSPRDDNVDIERQEQMQNFCNGGKQILKDEHVRYYDRFKVTCFALIRIAKGREILPNIRLPQRSFAK